MRLSHQAPRRHPTWSERNRMSDIRDETVLRDYLRKIDLAYRADNATEHTYRPMLKDLLEALDSAVTATNEPKRVACGAPDYVITSGQRTIGYVEAKDIGVSLDETERGDQLRRYRNALPSLLLTDYIEFRWYVDGQEKAPRVRRLATREAGHLILDKASLPAVANLLRSFLGHRAPNIAQPKDL